MLTVTFNLKIGLITKITIHISVNFKRGLLLCELAVFFQTILVIYRPTSVSWAYVSYELYYNFIYIFNIGLYLILYAKSVR